MASVQSLPQHRVTDSHDEGFDQYVEVFFEKKVEDGIPYGSTAHLTGSAIKLEAQEEIIETLCESDPTIVDWDGPDDPANPQNWSPKWKWANIASVAVLTFMVALASSMFAPGVHGVLDEFHTKNRSLATFVVSVYILGLAAGPLVAAPLSEVYGRLPIYHIGNALFILFTVSCALSNSMNILVTFRFLAGMAGAGPITIGAGTIADLTTAKQRSTAMSIWSIGPLIGPSVGPIAGGFLSQHLSWHWIFWAIAATAGAITAACVFLLRETHPATLLARKASRLRKATGDPRLRSKLDLALRPSQLLGRAILRPSKMLLFSPVCLIASVYAAFVYAIIYLMFTAFSFVFEQRYHFDDATVGLIYIALGLGMLLGVLIQQAIGDRLSDWLVRRHHDKAKPEYRIPPMFLGGALIPAGLLVYGWTAQHHAHWAVPLFGTLVAGVGICLITASINLYLIDVFTVYAASALAAVTVLRSVCGAVFPLCALYLYDALGLGWGNSLLAFIALAMLAIPPLFFHYGERLRARFPVQL